MEKKTWNSILKKIAKEKGFSDWSEYVFLTDKPTSEMYEEAAQRYADQEKKAYATEAVKKDRDRVFGEFKMLDNTDFTDAIRYMDQLITIHEDLSIELP